MAITVPDPDFHDFDTDRSEEVFKPKQIWAIYDEEDGMPRLYCLVRQVISVKPFQLHITYLNSKPDAEFGFNKSCGSFKLAHSVLLTKSTSFLIFWEERILVREGVLRYTQKEAIYGLCIEMGQTKSQKKEGQQYEMVEILEDYSEKLGVCVTTFGETRRVQDCFIKETITEHGTVNSQKRNGAVFTPGSSLFAKRSRL
ncbi:hypothetical protein R6Q59_022601 [Mikania micrantha]